MDKNRIIKGAITTLLLLLILIIEGCFNFVTLKFDFNNLKNITFWINIGLRITLLTIVRLMMYNIFPDIARKNNKELQVEKAKNEKLVKLKDADFPFWIENVKNKEIKIEAWKSFINKKLMKLDKKASDEDIHLYYDNTISEEEKMKNNYYRLKTHFLALLTNDFIESNINTLNVKYERLNASIFDLPVNLEKTDNNNQIVSKSKSTMIINLGVTAIGLVITNIFTSGLRFGKGEAILLETIISLCFDLIYMVYQALMGILDSYRIINSQELLPYINRNRILKEYFYYKKPDEKSRIDQLFNTLDNAPN